jgi:hypothetical protein
MTSFVRPTGSLSARTKGAEIILRERALYARTLARAIDEPSYEAAALRGKAVAYKEAADLLDRINRGKRLGFHRWTRKDKTRERP